MNECRWTPDYHHPGTTCREPGTLIHLGCACLHVYPAVLCAEHSARPGLSCHYCATGPAGHRCPLTVLEVAA